MEEKNDLEKLLGTLDEQGNPIESTDPPAETDPQTGDTAPAASDPISQESDKTDPEDGGDDEQKGSSVIRTLRANVKESKAEAEAARAEVEAERKLLARIAAKRNITVDQLKKEIEEEDIAVEAKKVNMSPEALTAYKKLEQEVKALREETQRKEFNTKVFDFQNKLGLTEDQVVEFMETAQARGINLLTQNINFEDVYYAVNRTSIESKIREEERQKILIDIERQKARGPVGTRTIGSDGAGKKSIKDLYDDIGKLGNI